MKLILVAAIVVTLTVSTGGARADWESCMANRTCPESWHLYGSHCLKFFNQRLTWSAANSACQAEFSDQFRQFPEYRPTLAAVKGSSMNAFIHQLYKDGLTGIDTLNGRPTDRVCTGTLSHQRHM